MDLMISRRDQIVDYKTYTRNPSYPVGMIPPFQERHQSSACGYQLDAQRLNNQDLRSGQIPPSVNKAFKSHLL